MAWPGLGPETDGWEGVVAPQPTHGSPTHTPSLHPQRHTLGSSSEKVGFPGISGSTGPLVLLPQEDSQLIIGGNPVPVSLRSLLTPPTTGAKCLKMLLGKQANPQGKVAPNHTKVTRLPQAARVELMV